jgi:hypothetical protein
MSQDLRISVSAVYGRNDDPLPVLGALMKLMLPSYIFLREKS